jgi:hypothetical protein
MKFSLFANAHAEKPTGVYELPGFIEAIKSGVWKKEVERVRASKGAKNYQALKAALPAVTGSGEFKTRNKEVPLQKRIKKHSEYIWLDVDKKDNPRMRTKDVIDPECAAQFVSCGGEGVKIIYRCEPTNDRHVQHRIYDAAVKRLEKMKIKLKVDPVVKSLANLQYVSFDPNAFINTKTKLVIKPGPAPKKLNVKPSDDVARELKQLDEYIEALGDTDITTDYENWLLVALGLSYSLGEAGREPFHRLSSKYPGYSKVEADEKYDGCMDADFQNLERPVTIATVYQLLNDNLPKPVVKQLGKKWTINHTLGVAEEATEGQPDLSGLARYKLFLFKKIIDKESKMLMDLQPVELNLNAFEKLLRDLGFFRYTHLGDRMFVHVVDNIVEEVDAHDILRIVTEHVEKEGDYEFQYKKLNFKFSWEELAHLWRKIRPTGTIINQILASVTHWEPNVLKDTADTSYLPYRNGVVVVTKDGWQLKPYSSMTKQIWKEQILPRDFVYSKKIGMFEQFYMNICGRGETIKKKALSENFRRALWYFGYMLQGNKRQSLSRALILYDVKTGNNGRSGKTIIGSALGKLRNVTVIDGKQVDFKNRFAWQTVKPWTHIVFMDDVAKGMSLVPLFNMISGGLYADQKNASPLELWVKFLISSNWVLEAGGSSEKGRQFIIQVDDFYVKWGKEHGDTLTPIVDFHGKEFFTDWNDHDWNEFDSFGVRALHFHLSQTAPDNTIIGNALQLRFIQFYEEELFFALCIAFATHVQAAKKGEGLLIGQQILTNVLMDNNENLKANRAGKIAREFLAAIGFGDAEITTININGSIKQAYASKVNVKQLDLGPANGKVVFKNL